MANTIDWGQGSVNNTNGWGKSATNNTIDFGEICADSWSPETNLVGGSAVFSNTKSILTDGFDDFVTMGNVLQTSNTGADPMSMSIWFKTTDSSTQILMSKWYNPSPYGGYSMHITGNNMLTFFIGSFQGNEYILVRKSIASISDGSWHHVAATYDGSRDANGVTLYYDGSPVINPGIIRNVAPNYINVNPVDFTIGARGTVSSNAFHFNGNLDEGSYFDSELSASDITTIYGTGVPNDISSLSPVGYWRFEGTGTTATDNGSGANNGTLTNGVTRSTDIPT